MFATSGVLVSIFLDDVVVVVYSLTTAIAIVMFASDSFGKVTNILIVVVCFYQLFV
jgi:hypothetical protein